MTIAFIADNGSVVSFVLIKSETHASYYEEQFYYNIDLETERSSLCLICSGPILKLSSTRA